VQPRLEELERRIVLDGNSPPVAMESSFMLRHNSWLSAQVQAFDPDFDPLTFGAGSYPAHGSLYVDPYGSFSYTPLPSFSGSDSFTFWVSDGTHQSYATALINVTGAGLSVGDISGNEGDGGTTPFMFWVSRAGDLSGTASVQYATRSRSTASRCRKASPSRCRRCSPSPSPSRRACR
jgi:hypothetical protein